MSENWDDVGMATFDKPSGQSLRGFGRGKILQESTNGNVDGFGSGNKNNGFGGGPKGNGFSNDWKKEKPSFGGRDDEAEGGERGFSSGSSRGGGSGGGRGCHKCGEEGHFARECPTGGGGSSGSRGCHKCGENGHMARECPTGGGGRGCHKCGETGHMARECPTGGGGGRGCHKCGETGHMARECPTGGGGGGRGCHKCGETGHMARECPSGGGGFGGSDDAKSGGFGGGGRSGGFGGSDNAKSGGSRGGGFGGSDNAKSGGFGGGGRSGGSDDAMSGGFGGGSRGGGFGGSDDTKSRGFGGSNRGGGFGGSVDTKSGGFGSDSKTSGGGVGGSGCRKCGEEGHFARECPNAGGGAGGSGCRKCGEEGHFARECPNAGEGGGKGGACHKCGEEGHFARECPKALAQGEKPREIYVPPEIGDTEVLFKMGIHQGINFDKYDNIEVEVTGNNRPKPVEQFDDMDLLPTFLQNVKKAGYIKPTPIQKHAIPAIMSGRDLMGCAQTGSGKTAAFILPVLTAMVKEGLTSSQFSTVQEPQAIVIAPTRELAIQIASEARKFSWRTDVRAVVVYGGTSVSHQIREIERGVNLVVGTPGRLLDFIEKGKISLAKVKFLVLDEADRMLDMGFEPCIRRLVDTMGMPPKSQRQTLMFSATFKSDIQKLAADFLNDYLFISVGIVGGACSDVEQTFLEVDRMQKREYLCDILNTLGTNRVLVFVGQKRNADFLASFLSQSGYPTTSIHGDRLQREREEALKDFKDGKAPVLIATNVAARGLDIPDVTHVINYDLPTDIDEYVHRIGRTGRCGNIGKATSFYSHDTDSTLAHDLVKILAESQQEVPDWLTEYAGQGGNSDAGRISGRFGGKDIRRKGKVDGGGYGGDTAEMGRAVDNTADDEAWD